MSTRTNPPCPYATLFRTLAEYRVAEAQFVDDDVQRRHAGGVDVVVGRRFLVRRRLVGAALLRRRIPEHAREPAGDRCAVGARDRQGSGKPRAVDSDLGAAGRRLRTPDRKSGVKGTRW